jgi:hypothetical protein
MPKYRIAYYEDSVYLKTFEGKNKDDAFKKAHDELCENGWDTADWEVGNGHGGQLEIIEELSK